MLGRTLKRVVMAMLFLTWIFSFYSGGARASEWGWSVTEVPVTLMPGDQKVPAIDGETVFFRDYSLTAAGRLMKKDIFEGIEEEFAGPGVIAGPDADGGAVAWQNSSKLICMRSLGGDPDRCVTSPTATRFAFSGVHAIIEQGSGTKISLISFDTLSSKTLDSSTLPGMKRQPDIDGGQAVWIKERGYAGRYYEPLIVSYSLSSGVATYLTRTGGGTNSKGASKYQRINPTISNGRVLYQQKINEVGEQWDIAEAVFDTFGSTVVDAPGDQIYPSLSGNLVVYQDNRNGHYDESGKWIDDWDIYMKDLESGIEQPVCTAPGNQSSPVIKGNIIAWEDSRNGSVDIYAAVLAQAAADEQLMQAYSPLLVMHRNEDFMPADVGAMVSGAGTTLKEGGSERLSTPGTLTLDALGGFGPGAYIDLPGRCLTCGIHLPDPDFDRYIRADYVRPYRAVMSAGDRFEAAYGRVVRMGDRTVIQYWLNYYFNNHPMLGHEGDWELVEVELDRDLKPVRVSGSQHGHGKIRRWQDIGVVDGHPLIYVARGSHANYFESGSHSVEMSGLPNPLVMDETDSFADSRAVQPRVVPLPGSVFDFPGYRWLAFAGRWGEVNGKPGGDPPVGPAWSGDRWSSPFAWSGLEWDGWRGLAGKLVGFEVSVGLGVDVDLYDFQGRHVGREASGGIEKNIPGSQYIEAADSGRKTIIIPDQGPAASYLLKLSGAAAQSAPVTLTFFEPASGLVTEAYYGQVNVGGGAAASLAIGPGSQAEAYSLSIDLHGDGVADTTQPPDELTTRGADTMAPGSVGDLTIGGDGGGVARLSWTAPGDDGYSGTATAYMLRYSSEPINSDNWNDAEPVSISTAPAAAGAVEAVTTTDLPSDKDLYFAVRSVDDAGNVSGPSNVTMVARPRLSLVAAAIAWESYSDYLQRQLSVSYRVGNNGSGKAFGFTIHGVSTTPASVTIAEQMNLTIGEIAPGQTAEFKVKFLVPGGVLRFVTSMSASCRDEIGMELWFPGPPGQVQ